MTAGLQRRPNGARLPFGEWFNAIIDFLNSQYTTKAIQVVAAAGATQGGATQISSTKGHIVKVTVTASTEGVKLPTATTGDQWTVLADPSVGVKVYPATGDRIAAGATNAAYSLVKATSTVFYAVDAVFWRVVKGG